MSAGKGGRVYRRTRGRRQAAEPNQQVATRKTWGTAEQLAVEIHRHRRLAQGRGYAWRRFDLRTVIENNGIETYSGALFYRGSRGRYRLARRLQFSMGVGIRVCGRPGGLRFSKFTDIQTEGFLNVLFLCFGNISQIL